MPSPISAVMVYNNNVVHLHHSPSILPFIIATTMSKLESRPSLKVIDDKAFRHSVTKIEEVAEISEYPFTKEENRCIVRKFDWHILPFVWGTLLLFGIYHASILISKLMAGVSLLSLQLPRS